MKRNLIAGIGLAIILPIIGCGSDAGSFAPQLVGLSKVGGDGQQASVGSAVATPPSVRVADSGGHGIPNVRVTFKVQAGGGTVVDAVQVTNASGVAEVGGWVLGPTAGQNMLAAEARGQNIVPNPVTFTATANGGM